MKKLYFSKSFLILPAFALLFPVACTWHVPHKTTFTYSSTNEVNAAFSQVIYPPAPVSQPDTFSLTASTETLVLSERIQAVPVQPTAAGTYPEKSIQILRKKAQLDDPPVLVKKRLPFWKILLGVLLSLIGIGITLYCLGSLAVLAIVAVFLLLFGLELWITNLIVVFILALLLLVAGIFISIAGYNLLVRDPLKRILIRRRIRK